MLSTRRRAAFAASRQPVGHNRKSWRHFSSLLLVLLWTLLFSFSYTKVDLKNWLISSSPFVSVKSWCDRVHEARAKLSPLYHIDVPCETMKPAHSAVVCMLTDGVASEKVSAGIFSAKNYIHGAMALGASLQGRIDPERTHQLLLLRQGFVLDTDDSFHLQSVGWIIGTAPNINLPINYVPAYPRYKTTYTKVSAIGLAEYECVWLMDADVLVTGDLKDMLTCNMFTEPQHQVAAGLDLYSGYWHYFNTGSIIWRTSSAEMERVFGLIQDPNFMQRFSSDQAFLNSVYPERLNNAMNRAIIEGNITQIPGGKVVDFGWGYNAQTHVEVDRSEWWESKRPTVNVLHFTEKKGWQCEERHQPPPPISDLPKNCRKDVSAPLCFCREAHLYWNALAKAKAAAVQALAKSSNRNM